MGSAETCARRLVNLTVNHVSAFTPLSHGAFTYVVHLLVILALCFFSILGARIKLPKVSTWPIRVISYQCYSLGIVILAGFSWENGCQRICLPLGRARFADFLEESLVIHRDFRVITGGTGGRHEPRGYPGGLLFTRFHHSPHALKSHHVFLQAPAGYAR